MPNTLSIALSAQVEDDKHYIHDGAGEGLFSLDLASIAAKVGVPVEALTAAVQDEIKALDAADTVPNDGAYEAGFVKKIPVKATLFGFIRISDNVTATAGLVVKVD